MGLELKCPLCLNLLNKPILLPCDHIFCSSCITNSSQFKQDCFLCKSPYADQDKRSVPHMENVISIYKSMDVAFSATLLQSSSQSNISVGKFTMSHSPVSANRVDKLQNEDIETSPNKQVQESLCPTETKKPLESGVRRDIGEVKIGQSGADLNQMSQTLTASPPSFGEMKDSDDDSSGHGGQNTAENMPTMERIKKKSEDATICARETKRQKLEFWSPDAAGANGVNPQPGYSDSDGGCKSSGPLFGAQAACTPVRQDENTSFICAFCHSSKLSEGSGPMLHIANGEEVEADELSQPNVLHVHRKCIEWAPQVYFVGETVMNLEQELARGSKLRCSSCGLKGAALGCYLRSCRKTFHVPCAFHTSGCRWDYEGHQILCPTHSHMKFPHEKKKGKKLVMNHSSTTQMVDQPTRPWAVSAGATSELVLCGSSLSAEEKHLLAKFARISGVTVSKIWKPNVTHVIASTDGMGACSRTLKFLMAILNGRWVLKIDWIKTCMEAMDLVNEEPYEVGLDIHGCHDGPKNGRLRVKEKAPKLFSSLNFYFSGDFVPSYKESLEELVLAAGGTILTKNSLSSQKCDEGGFSSTTLVVYSLDPPPNLESEEASAVVIESRRKEAEALSEQSGYWVIGHTWLLESIAASKLQPIAC